MIRRRNRGIFCLEGDWWNDLNHSASVKPVLELLCQVEKALCFIYRDVGTVAEFDHYLNKWSQQSRAKYPILYLAFHGNAEGLSIGDARRRDARVTLDALAEKLKGKCKGKLIHLGSCSTLDLDERHIQRFLQTTGATAIAGFRSDVEWLKASAFDMLFFELILRGSLTIAGARRIKRLVSDELDELAKELGFRMVIRK